MTEVVAPCEVSVVVEEPIGVSVVTVEGQAEVSVVTVAEQGPPGPPGPPGNANVGGYPVEVEDVKNGDLLVFSGDAWTNENKVVITDGGSF